MFRPPLSGYAHKQLSGDEKVLRFDHRHPITILGGIATVLVGLAVALVLLLVALFADFDEVWRAASAGLALVFVLLTIPSGLMMWLRWRFTEYVLTDRRLMIVRGIVAKRVNEASLDKINDAVFHQSLGGRLWNYGDLEIITASEEPDLSDLRSVRDALEFAKAISEAREVRRERMPPGMRPVLEG